MIAEIASELNTTHLRLVEAAPVLKVVPMIEGEITTVETAAERVMRQWDRLIQIRRGSKTAKHYGINSSQADLSELPDGLKGIAMLGGSILVDPTGFHQVKHSDASREVALNPIR